MRIGIFLEYLPTNGGAYQQALSLIQFLKGTNEFPHSFVVFTPFRKTRQLLASYGIDAIQFKHTRFRLLDRWSTTFLGNGILRRLQKLGFRRVGRHLDALLDDHRIDLVIINHQCEIASRIGDHPFLITVFDLDNRNHPEFPEFFRDRIFEREERWMYPTLIRAVAVITDNSITANRIAHIYGVDCNRIIELPFVPSYSVRRRASGEVFRSANEIGRKYDLPTAYLFYPASFLPHKNHLYLLEGLLDLERRFGIELNAVFSGGDPRGHLVIIQRQAQALGLSKRVRFLGFVPEEDMPGLYEGSFVVVVPSYFGPTNLQPIEAVALGRPVICSDFPECRKQMGDAALYCDLTNPASLADYLAALAKDRYLVERLQAAGRNLAQDLRELNYRQRLSCVFDDFAYKRRRWKWPEELD